jgi:hypothetical protein
MKNVAVMGAQWYSGNTSRFGGIAFHLATDTITMKHKIRWMALVLVVGCSDAPTTQTGVLPRPPVGPPTIPATTYQIILLTADTATVDGDVVFTQRVSIRTRDGLAVVAAEVDFGATEGSVQPETMSMASDGTAQVTWIIPPSIRVANLLGCARPPLGTCRPGPILKWNQ